MRGCVGAAPVSCASPRPSARSARHPGGGWSERALPPGPRGRVVEGCPHRVGAGDGVDAPPGPRAGGRRLGGGGRGGARAHPGVGGGARRPFGSDAPASGGAAGGSVGPGNAAGLGGRAGRSPHSHHLVPEGDRSGGRPQPPAAHPPLRRTGPRTGPATPSARPRSSGRTRVLRLPSPGRGAQAGRDRYPGVPGSPSSGSRRRRKAGRPVPAAPFPARRRPLDQRLGARCNEGRPGRRPGG